MDAYPDISVSWSIQTNGISLNEGWMEMLKRRQFLTGLSLDGFQSSMDKYRVDAEGKRVFFPVMHSLDLLRKSGVSYNVLTVITRSLARHPETLYSFYVRHRIVYVQLIPCLPTLRNKADSCSLTPELFASFYIRFFDAWWKGIRNGNFLSVNLFENFLEMLQGRLPYQCGLIGSCFNQFVIEANGSVYPCDFYCLDDCRLGSLKTQNFAQLDASKTARDFLSSSAYMKQPCGTCRYQKMCFGGCRRANVS